MLLSSNKDSSFFCAQFTYSLMKNIKGGIHNGRIQEDENSGVEWLDFDTLMDKEIEEKMKPVYAKLIKKTKKL